MYEQVRQGDRDGISIDEEFLKNTLDKQASNDQKTTQIVSQTKTAISRRGRPWECDHHTLDAITTGAALVLRLVTGSSTKPHDFPHFGHGCNLPVRNIVCNGFLTEKPKRQKLVSIGELPMSWRPRMFLPPWTCKIAGPKAYWTQSLGAYSQVYVYTRHSAALKSTSWTKIYLSLAETQQGLFSLKLPDIHLSLTNPQVC